jgi:predicted aldo/keto reductase-like oxidoreductase
MRYRELGNTGIAVSRLCFGTLTLGKMHLNLGVREGADLLRAASDYGVTFFDTATIYETYKYLRAAFSPAEQVVIASRTYAYDAAGARKDLELALRSLDRETIDIFGLHEQVSAATLSGHSDAWEYLVRAKEAGKIRALLVSTHYVQAVDAAASMQDVDVIHPLLNVKGLGIRDGGAKDMLAAISRAHELGKGIYSMKALAGGHLSGTALEALRWAAAIPEVDAVAVGMGREDEVDFSAAVFSGCEVPLHVCSQLQAVRRRVEVEGWCSGCGRCVTHCPQGAITIVGRKASVDNALCILCGYCAGACEDFCIKVMEHADTRD